MVGSLIKPPPWRRAWPAIIAVLLWSVGVAIGTMVYLTRPAPEPFVVAEDRAERLPGGIWRLETKSRIVSACRSVIVDREFAPEAQTAFRMAPIEASIPGLIADPAERRYVLSTQPGNVRLWLEYAEVSGLHGIYIIRIAAYDCDNGWSGALPPRFVPFDWR